MFRGFRRRPSGLWLSAVALATVVVARFIGELVTARTHDPRDQPLRDGPCEFVRVLDPVTMIMRQPSSGAIKNPIPDVTIRLLGVSLSPDDAQSQRNLAESSELFVRQFLTAGPVRLQLDKRQLDVDQRFLAYVLVGDQMLNEELARAGFVRIATRPGDSQSIVRRLRAAEGEARRRGRGLWSKVPAAPESSSEIPAREDC